MLQAQARAQAQNMAFQAHNLQAHAQQLEVESAHPATHINVAMQHQIDQVSMHGPAVCIAVSARRALTAASLHLLSMDGFASFCACSCCC